MIKYVLGKEQLLQITIISTNNFEIGALETNRVYHIDDIKKICISYRLRFLNSQLFKADLPYEAIQNIKDLEKTHETSLSGFKIMAPSKLFKLANADDPLLFAPIENGYYYLIHKWGNRFKSFSQNQNVAINKFRKFYFYGIYNFSTCNIFITSRFFYE